MLVEDVIWEWNRVNYRGIDAVQGYNQALERTKHLRIEHVLSHGKFGACHAILQATDASYGMALFFEFKSTSSLLIKRITGYLIPLN